MGAPLVFSGARAIINISDRLAIFATEASYTIETAHRPLLEVDNSLPNELAPGLIRTQVTVTNLRVPFNSPSVDRIQATINNNLTQPYVSIEIKDRSTDATILYVPQAMLTRRSGNIRARSLSSETWTFSGIGFWDERLPAEAEIPE